ncbi:MAG: TetR/AcrR family transcriptional regulator [Proteobacteria bacterium]|nr:TetR/AcrR family transcriptional regulator [Pseudomonadota bacterium]
METAASAADDPSQADAARLRILTAAAALIEQGGHDAATTRAVAAAAGVQPPTIYRLFGDKRGLLDAVALHSLKAYVATKAARPRSADPMQDLRDGWDMHVAFGLAHPGLFAILSGMASAPGSDAMQAGLEILRRRVKNLALAGQLRTSEERAVDLLRSVGTGTVLTLLGQPAAQRDPGLSIAAREAVMATIAEPASSLTSPGANAAAATLRASLDQISTLTDGERLLLKELLDRIARDAKPSDAQ